MDELSWNELKALSEDVNKNPKGYVLVADNNALYVYEHNGNKSKELGECLGKERADIYGGQAIGFLLLINPQASHIDWW